MPAESADLHCQAAKFYRYVGALRQLGDSVFPFLKNFFASAGVGSDAERAADVIENDRCFRERACKVRQLRDLRVVVPGIEAQAVFVEAGKAFPKALLQKQAFGWIGVRVAHVVAGVPGASMANSAKAAIAGTDVRG